MVKVKIFREKNKEGKIISTTVTINKDGLVEKRRFADLKEANEFIQKLKDGDF